MTARVQTRVKSSIQIDLPSLESSATVEIVPENLHALQIVYHAAMIEELKVFQVADRLVEMFERGTLPLAKDKAGESLYPRWKNSDERSTELERRNLYERSFGFPSNDTSASPNREFNDLWLRFLSAVNSFQRQLSVDDLLRGKIPPPLSQEQVGRSGRDLAANLSMHGYGIAYFAARELQDQLQTITDLLSSQEILKAFGARDMFQFIDQVAASELGGTRNSSRYRTLADAGAVIIRWLANRRDMLISLRQVQVLKPGDIRKRRTAESLKKKASVDPTDYDLVQACEQWLAAQFSST